jgi:GAF domain-containing protein
VEGVSRSLGADHVAFVEARRPSGEDLVLAATGGQPVGVWPATGPFGSHLAFAMQSHRPIVVRDFAAERRFDRGPLAGEQAGVSGLCSPVRWTGGEGALCVHSSTEHLALTSADVTFVQSAPNLCALALAGAPGV